MRLNYDLFVSAEASQPIRAAISFVSTAPMANYSLVAGDRCVCVCVCAHLSSSHHLDKALVPIREMC